MRLSGKIRGALALAMGLTLAGPSMAQDLREITYGLPSKSLVAAAPRIADEMGLFSKHGIKPVFRFIATTAGTTAALLSNSVQFAETGSTEVIAAAARGQQLVIIANHYAGLSGALVLSKQAVKKTGVLADAPIAERLKAVDGLLLASTSAVSTFTISYKTAAEAAGVKPRFTYMAMSAMGAALESGAVDGVIMTAPLWAFPVLKGTGELWVHPAKGELDATFMPATAALTATTKAFAEANSVLAKDVAAVFDDYAVAVATRPDEVKSAIVRLFPEIDAKTVDLVFSLESKAFATRPLTPADITHDSAYMKQSGGNFGAIDSVDPASVLIAR
jgi:ABC-type nitrate/sulfonate/bicarbonate transport system substrate-binding protein